MITRESTREAAEAGRQRGWKELGYAAANCSSHQLSCALHPQIILTDRKTITQSVANTASQFTFSPNCSFLPLAPAYLWSQGEFDQRIKWGLGRGRDPCLYPCFFPVWISIQREFTTQIVQRLCWCNGRYKTKQPWHLNRQNGQNAMTELQA